MYRGRKNGSIPKYVSFKDTIIISLNEALGSHASGTKMEYNFSQELIRGRKILKDNLI